MRVVVALALASCSFATVRGPDAPPKPPGDCTQQSSSPALDTLGMGVGIAGMVLGALAVRAGQQCGVEHPPGYNHEGCAAEAGVGVLLFVPSALATAVYGMSMVHGRHAIASCRERLAEPPPPPVAAPVASAESWFCTESGTEGICKPSRELCEAFRSRSQHPLSECTWRVTVTCFELGTDSHCAPTAEICETLHAAAERYASGPVGACELRKSEALLPPADTSTPRASGDEN